jgi:hypothetical protein
MLAAPVRRGFNQGSDIGKSGENPANETVIPGRCVSIEPGISRFPDAQLRI